MDFQTLFQDWLTDLVAFLPHIIAAVMIFIATVILSGIAARSIHKVGERKISSEEMLLLLSRITRWTVLILGTVVALGQVNFDVTGFIAGLGVAGFTIGFALQDIAKNFISGLLLLYRQPFNIGDNVKIAEFTGKVVRINIRDTEIETLDGESVIIPNRDVYGNPILNYTHSRLRRRSVMIGLGYEQDSKQAITVFLETINSVPGVCSEPIPTVQAKSFGESALMMEALFWVDQRTDDLLGVHSEVVQAIKRAAEENAINLPYPVQTILLETPVGEAQD